MLEAIEAFSLVLVDRRILERATEPELAIAARAVGFRVQGPPARAEAPGVTRVDPGAAAR